MAFAVPFKAKFPAWPEDTSTDCSPWRTAQLILVVNTAISPAFAGVNSWYAREENVVEEKNVFTMVGGGRDGSSQHPRIRADS